MLAKINPDDIYEYSTLISKNPYGKSDYFIFKIQEIVLPRRILNFMGNIPELFQNMKPTQKLFCNTSYELYNCVKKDNRPFLLPLTSLFTISFTVHFTTS